MVACWRLIDASLVLTFSNWSVIGTGLVMAWYLDFTVDLAVVVAIARASLAHILVQLAIKLSSLYYTLNAFDSSPVTIGAVIKDPRWPPQLSLQWNRNDVCVSAYHSGCYNGCYTFLTAFQVVDAGQWHCNVVTSEPHPSSGRYTLSQAAKHIRTWFFKLYRKETCTLWHLEAKRREASLWSPVMWPCFYVNFRDGDFELYTSYLLLQSQFSKFSVRY